MSQLPADIDREISEVLLSFQNMRLNELGEVPNITNLCASITAIGLNLQKSWEGLQSVKQLEEQARVKVVEAEREATSIKERAKIAARDIEDNVNKLLTAAQTIKNATESIKEDAETIKENVESIKKDAEKNRDELKLAFETVNAHNAHNAHNAELAQKVRDYNIYGLELIFVGNHSSTVKEEISNSRGIPSAKEKENEIELDRVLKQTDEIVRRHQTEPVHDRPFSIPSHCSIPYRDGKLD